MKPNSSIGTFALCAGNPRWARMALSAILVLVPLIFVGCKAEDDAASTGTLQTITVTPADSSIAVGETVQFAATGNLSDNTTEDVTSTSTWTADDDTVATISSGGLATAVAVGTVTVTATKNGVTATTTLAVTTAATLTSIAVTAASSSIEVGATSQLTATGTFEDDTTADITDSVTWSSSDDTVATVDSAGLATGVAIGSVTITATDDTTAVSATATLTVTTAGGLTFTNGDGIAEITGLPVLPASVDPAVNFDVTVPVDSDTLGVSVQFVEIVQTDFGEAFASRGGGYTDITAGTAQTATVSVTPSNSGSPGTYMVWITVCPTDTICSLAVDNTFYSNSFTAAGTYQKEIEVDGVTTTVETGVDYPTTTVP